MNILTSKRAFYSGLLLLGLLAMTARNAVDPDLWWHLRTGQLIVETGRIPHSDSFSFTRAGSPWVSHEWLSEAAFYELWKHGGPVALILFSSVITTAGFLFLYLRCAARPHWSAAATVLAAWASAPCWGVRPQMFTFVFASIFLWLLERSNNSANARPRLLLWIPPLFLLWLNLHGGFALGIALLFLFTAGLTLEVAAGTTPWRQARPTILRVLTITLACLALVPLNPAGTELYRYPLETLRSAGMRALIVEWFSPDFHQWLYLPFLLVFLLLLCALFVSRAPVKGRILLPLIFTSFAAFDAVRHIPIFVLLAIPVIAENLTVSSGLRAETAIASSPEPATRFQVSLRAALVLFLAAFAVWRWTSLARDQDKREAALFPRQAVTFLEASGRPDRLFVFYDWGGYAIWRLNPRYRVFADGRADLYGDELLRQSTQTVIQLRQGWRTVLDSWDVGTILVPPSTALTQALLRDPEWTVPYRDTQAVVFVRAIAPRR